MSADDRAKRALELLQRALASEGTLRTGVRELRSKLGEARVKLMDEVVSTLSRRPVNTQARSLFKQAAAIAAEALRESSTPPTRSPAPPPPPPPPAAPPPVVAPPSAAPPAPAPAAPILKQPPAPVAPKPPAPPPVPAPARTGPRPAPTPARPPEVRVRPTSPTLGVARLQLIARDPEWVYAYWELEPNGASVPELLRLVLVDADTGDRMAEAEAAPAERHVAFRRPGAGRRYAAIVDDRGGWLIRSAVVEVPSVDPAPAQPVRFVAPSGRAPAEVAAAIESAPYVSPPRVLGWSPALWRFYAAQVSWARGSSPGPGR